MRIDKVFTNLRCNQNCSFCTFRRPEDDRAYIVQSAVLGRIDASLSRGASQLIFTGGEPTMRHDLEVLIAHAKQKGAERIVLETNATLIDQERAQSLREAGLDIARVHLPAFSEELDALTRDPGGFQRALRGARALLDAGITLEISATVVEGTLSSLALLPTHLAESLPGTSAILLNVPVETPDRSQLVSYEDAAEAISQLNDAARAVGITVRLDPSSGPPPCVFPARAKTAHLYSLNRGSRRRPGFQQVEGCRSCKLEASCSGLPSTYLARRPAPPMRPIREDRLRRRLSMVASVDEQIEREMVTLNHWRDGESERFEHIVRINFQCNQACRFCFVSTHLPAPEESAVREAIERAGGEGARIILSGGEPTLNPKLLDYLLLAKSVSSLPVELQTNAILLDDPGYVQRLVEAGLDQAFVSLHGSRAEVSDEVTGAPGTFQRTVVGIDNLVQSPIVTVLNFVICQRNHGDLVPFVRMAIERWDKALLNLSFVAPSTDLVPRDRALIPRYSDVLPAIDEAMKLARAHDKRIMGFDSMCGIPLCLVPDDLREFFDMAQIPDGFDGGEFIRAPACQGCALDGKCYGLRRGYAELYGSDELRAVPHYE